MKQKTKENIKNLVFKIKTLCLKTAWIFKPAPRQKLPQKPATFGFLSWSFFIFSFFFFSFFSFFLFSTLSPVQAATCNDIANGNWNNSATWDCGIVPDSDDDVTIDSHTVTMTVDQSVLGMTIDGGTLNMGSYTLSSYGNWTYNSGTIDAGTSTLAFKNTTTNQTITPGDVSYFKVVIDKGHYDLNVNNVLEVSNELRIKSNGSNSELLGGTIEVEGDIVMESSVTSGGSTVIKLTGSQNQNIYSNGGKFSSLRFEKTGGTVTIMDDLTILRDWNYVSGNVDVNNKTLEFYASSGNGPSSTFTPGDIEYYNLTVSKNNWDLTIDGTVKLKNELRINPGSTSGLFGGTIEVEGDVVMATDSFDGGSTIIKFVGEKDQLLSSQGGHFPNLAFEKTGGSVSMSGVIAVEGDWIYSSGDIYSGTSTLKFVGTTNSSFTPGDVNYYNISIEKSMNYAVTLNGDLRVINEFRIADYGKFLNTTGNYKIITKNFVQTGGEIQLGSGALKIIGNFTRTGGTFTAGTSVVSFQGKNQVIDVTGVPTTFYKLYKLVNSADTLTITAGNTITIASGGVMRFRGKYEDVYGNPATLSIVSSSPGTAYNIIRTGSAELEYTNWSDANWSAAQTAAASTLGTGNTNLTVTKEFISTIRATDGDYTTLSAWEAAINCDLTAATTKVFSHSGITGVIPDNTTVTGATSGATGTAVHATATQILIKDITGTFQSGEQVQVDGSNYLTISDDGYGAIATAHPYNDWPSGLDDYVTIDGWTTDSTHFVNVYVPKSEKHKGKAGTGFYLKNTASAYAINIEEYYTHLTGIEIANNPATALQASFSAGGSGPRVSQLLIHNASGYCVHSSSAYAPIYLSSSIIYNCSNIGFFAGCSNNSSILYNSSVYGVDSDGVRWESNMRVKNVIAFANSQDFSFYSFPNSWVKHNLSSDSTAPGTNSLTNQTLSDIDFISTTDGAEDLHIQDTSTANEAGADLSIDPDFPIIDDIDGQTRPVWDAWDIGADQTPKKIYRSVGPSNTTALATGSSNDLNIASDWAIFSSALPDNIGVGDAIQYDSDDDGTIDAIAFISERISSTYYRIQDYKGETPTQTSAADNDWSIFRAYTSLANAEKGNENDGIDDSVENFDDWTPGGTKDADEGGRDLTVDDVQWNIACYGDAVDTSSTWINGWTTSAQNYIKIYTPVNSTEVGESQRHIGKANTGYKIKSSNYGFVLYDNYQWIDGLEIEDIPGEGNIPIYVSSSGSKEFKISNNLIYYNGNAGLFIHSGNNSYKIWNNIFYGDHKGIYSLGTRTAYIYNNTFFYTGVYPNSETAIYGGANTIAKNNIAIGYGGQNSYYCFTGTFHTDSDYNISSDNSAPGSHSKKSTDVLFRSTPDYDFHLHLNDTAARNAGVDLSNDSYLPFSTDIDGQTRSGSWDIGADETQGQTVRFKGSIKMRGVRLGE